MNDKSLITNLMVFGAGILVGVIIYYIFLSSFPPYEISDEAYTHYFEILDNTMIKNCRND